MRLPHLFAVAALALGAALAGCKDAGTPGGATTTTTPPPTAMPPASAASN